MRGTMNDFQREGLGPWHLRGDQPATRGKPDWDRDVIVRVAMGQLNLSPSVTPCAKAFTGKTTSNPKNAATDRRMFVCIARMARFTP